MLYNEDGNSHQCVMSHCPYQCLNLCTEYIHNLANYEAETHPLYDSGS